MEGVFPGAEGEGKLLEDDERAESEGDIPGGKMRRRGATVGKQARIGCVWPDALTRSIMISAETMKKRERLGRGWGAVGGKCVTGSSVFGAGHTPVRGGRGQACALPPAVAVPAADIQAVPSRSREGNHYPIRVPQSTTTQPSTSEKLYLCSAPNYPPIWQLSAWDDEGGCRRLCSDKPQ